jgi:membrane protein
MTTTASTKRPPAPEAGPSSPGKLSGSAVRTALVKAVKEFDRDNAWDWSAALTYYGVLSIFPGLVVIVSLIGLFGRDAQPLLDSVSGMAPGPVREIIHESVTGLQDSTATAGLAAAFGVVGGLWSASGYVGAFMRATNAIYDVPEGRPMWKTMPIRLGVTVATGVLLVLSAVIVVVSGGVASAVGRSLGLEHATVQVWNIAKWPVLVVLVSVLFAILYWASPNARQGGFKWVSPGGVLAVLLWMLASLGFGLYAANFGSYDKTYGTIAGVIVLLVWLWISNLAILLGAEFNGELERQRAIAAGMSPSQEPYMQLRDERAADSHHDPGLEDPQPDDPHNTQPPSTPRPPGSRSDKPRSGLVAGMVAGAVLGTAATLWIDRIHRQR